MDTTTPQYKRCTNCGEVRPITHFWKNSAFHRDGHDSQCKFCRTEKARQRRLEQARNQACNDVKLFTDEVLITELKRRGFSGELRYMQKVTI